MIKNNFLHGLIIGIFLPVLAFAFVWGVNLAFMQAENFNFSFKQSTVALLSICANLIPVLIANKNRYEEFIRGIMFPTVLGSFIWFFYYDPVNMFGN
jgi:hypothetical protein